MEQQHVDTIREALLEKHGHTLAERDRWRVGSEGYQEYAAKLLLVEEALDTLNDAPVQDDNGGRRWWRMSKDGNSQPWCVDIAEMEGLWLSGWRPEYPLQAQPLEQQERSGLLTALALVKGKLRDIDKAFNGDVPTRVAVEVKELTVSATYLEQKLVELNEKQGLYEA